MHWNGWELIKGGLEDKESYEDCLKREIREESGIKNILKIKKLEGIHSWTYTQNGEKIKTEFVPFLVEVSSDSRIDVSKNPVHEHSQGFFLNFRDSYSILRYSNQKELLKQAYEILTSG